MSVTEVPPTESSGRQSDARLALVSVRDAADEVIGYMGTGYHLAADLVVTANHVLQSAGVIKVRVGSKPNWRTAERVTAHDELDIALIRVEGLIAVELPEIYRIDESISDVSAEVVGYVGRPGSEYRITRKRGAARQPTEVMGSQVTFSPQDRDVSPSAVAGLSGSPLWVANALVGFVVSADQRSGSIVATRVDALLAAIPDIVRLRALSLRPGARELLHLAVGIADARRSGEVTELDVVLAALYRPDHTNLDREALKQGATHALRSAVAEPVGDRLTDALRAAGVDIARLPDPSNAESLDDRAKAIAEVAEQIARDVGGSSVWSHHVASAGLRSLSLAPEVARALGTTVTVLRQSLRDAIRDRWDIPPNRQEDQEAWDRVLLPPAPGDEIDWVGDEPTDQDTLRRELIAIGLDAQMRKVCDDKKTSTFAIHIDGPWGAGKSSLLRLLNNKLSEWAWVDIDAWRESQVGPAWWTVTQALRRASASHFGTGGRLRFGAMSRLRLIGWRYPIAAAIFITMVAAVAAPIIILSPEDAKGEIGFAAGVISLAGLLWAGARSATRFVALDSSTGAQSFIEASSAPMKKLADELVWYVRQIQGPVVLAIDDLDRCDKEYVVRLLDAIQTILRTPQVPTRATSRRKFRRRRYRRPSGKVFLIVAADGRWLRASYESTHSEFLNPLEEPGRSMGYLFLDKLFQLTVPVPPLSDDQRHDFFSQACSEVIGFPPTTNGLTATKRRPPTFVPRSKPAGRVKTSTLCSSRRPLLSSNRSPPTQYGESTADRSRPGLNTSYNHTARCSLQTRVP